MGAGSQDSGDMLAFTAEQVRALTGLTDRQLRYWDKTDFFKPEILDAPRRAHRRVYTFRDVVGLRAIAELKRLKVTLQELRRVGSWLKAEHATPWSGLRLWVGGQRVYFTDPSSGAVLSASPERQAAILVSLIEVVASVRADASKLRERQRDDIGKIVADRFILGGAPRMAGTRIPVSAIQELHASGYSEAKILAEFPRLEPGDLHAALNYKKAG